MTAPAFVEPSTDLPGDFMSRIPTADEVNARLDAEAVDPEAPYGRKPDGTPYKVSQEKRAELGAQLAAGRARAAAGAPKTARRRGSGGGRGRGAASSRTAAPPAPSYAALAAGLLQIPALGLGIATRWVPSLAPDAMAVSYHTPAIAAAIGKIAEDDARWASVLEKAATVGPYGELAMTLLPLLMQLAVNHGMGAPVPEMQVYDPETLMEKAAGDAAA